MVPILFALFVAQADARVERVLDALAEKDCPRLFEMLTPSFQKSAPRAAWPGFCAQVGKLEGLEKKGSADGWLVFRAKAAQGPVVFKLAFQDEKISGLSVNPDATPLEAKTLEEALKAAIAANGVPGMGALVFRTSGEPLASAAAGKRKLGDDTPVTVDDKWHLGSDGKAMTATLAAMLVEEKKLKWSSTITEVLGANGLHPDWGKVTLELLLQHRAGLPPNVRPQTLARLFASKDPAKERLEAVREALAQAPSGVGTYVYSNLGYLVAGAMIERVGGASWEALLGKRIFAPLAMRTCGFGAPASPGKVDQPWGHDVSGGALVPVPPGPQADNPPAMGPAGTVHCALADWEKFARLHLAAARGEKAALLGAESFAKLRTPPQGGVYAMGWGIAEKPAAGGIRFAHDGSNTMFYVTVWMAPARDLGFFVAANAGNDGAEHAVDAVRSWIIDHYATAAAK